MSDLPAWALKDWVNEKYPHLTFLINSFIKLILIPTRLKRAIFSPIYKKDDAQTAKNYRPISKIGALSKVSKKLLYKQVNECLLSNNLLSQTKFVFRAAFSTMDAILYCTEFFRKSIDKNIYVAVFLLDLSKIFDSINHEHLKTKLDVLGFSESAI